MRTVLLALLVCAVPASGQDRPSDLLKKGDKLRDSEIETLPQAARDKLLALHREIHEIAQKRADEKHGESGRGLKEYNRTYDLQYSKSAELAILKSQLTFTQFLRVVGEETDKAKGVVVVVQKGKVCFAAEDEKTATELVSRIKDGDTVKVFAMVKVGLAFRIGPETKMAVLTADDNYISEVRILSGEQAGKRLLAYGVGVATDPGGAWVTEAEPDAEKNRKDGNPEGKLAVITNSSFAVSAIDQDTLGIFFQTVRDNDKEKAMLLAKLGRVIPLEEKCQISIISTTNRVSLIRVITGDSAGKKLYVKDVDSFSAEEKVKKK